MFTQGEDFCTLGSAEEGWKEKVNNEIKEDKLEVRWKEIRNKETKEERKTAS